MGGRVLWAVLRSFNSRRRFSRRLVWPPLDVLGWRRGFRGGLYCLRPLFGHSATCGCAKRPRYRGCLSRAWQPVDHQRKFRREKAWSSNWYLVRFHCDHNGGRAGTRRLLIQPASWRWGFFIYIPIAAAVIAISLRHIPEGRNAGAARVDWLGALFATVGLGGVVYGFIESTSLGWNQPLVFGSLIVGFGCLMGFAFVEARVSSPMIPLTLFESRSFSGATLRTLFLFAAL